MTVEQIAIRQEIRQMLSEAGVNKNTLKDMVKEALSEEAAKACKRAFNERDVVTMIRDKVPNDLEGIIRGQLREEIRNRVSYMLNRMTISVAITDKDGQSVITR